MSEKDRHFWRNGYTTGSCASGAAKAACERIKGKFRLTQVEIPLPQGERLKLPLKWVEPGSVGVRACIVKDGGDDPDVTDGIDVIAQVRILSPLGVVHIRGGRGVGTVTKPGLAVAVGESAINPVPRRMITEAVREVFPQEELEVLIEVPQGEEVAKHTLNPRLGILGGISILGTTGIVRPMSEEAFKASILPELDQAKAYGYRRIILTPGNYGFRTATQKLGVKPEAVVQMSNFIGFLLEEAAYRGFESVILLGHIGKLIKVAGGIFHTHNRVADARLEILLAMTALSGVEQERLQALAQFPTVEGAAGSLLDQGYKSVLDTLAAQASSRARLYVQDKLRIGTIFTRLDGSFMGWDEEAVHIFQMAEWKFPVLD